MKVAAVDEPPNPESVDRVDEPPNPESVDRVDKPPYPESVDRVDEPPYPESVDRVDEPPYPESSLNSRCSPRNLAALPAFAELMQQHTMSLFQLQHTKCMHGVVDSCHNLSSLKHP